MYVVSRAIDIGRKAWKYMLQSLEEPHNLPSLVWHGLQGVHIGEFLSLRGRWIERAGVTTVIDIGAHTGEFASAAGALLPDSRIYSFEPLKECYAKLRQRMKQHARFQCFNTAIGDRCGELIFHRSSFSKSSSALAMGVLHKENFPWSAQTVPLSVDVQTLDSFLSCITLEPKVLLKIDVQGFELPVLRGAVQILECVDYILIEVSFQHLYDGQALFDDIYQFLLNKGFIYVGTLGQIVSPIDGAILQADALFKALPDSQ